MSLSGRGSSISSPIIRKASTVVLLKLKLPVSVLTAV